LSYRNKKHSVEGLNFQILGFSMIAFHQRTFLNPKHAGVGGGAFGPPLPLFFIEA